MCLCVCVWGGGSRQYTVMRTTKPLGGGGGGGRGKNFDGIVNQAKKADLTKPNASHETKTKWRVIPKLTQRGQGEQPEGRWATVIGRKK